MEDFTIVIISSDNILYQNLADNYPNFTAMQNLYAIDGQANIQTSVFKYIDMASNWQKLLYEYKKIDILILEDLKLAMSKFSDYSNDSGHYSNSNYYGDSNYSSGDELISFIDNKVSKLLNLTGTQLSSKELNLSKPIKLIELLEIINRLKNTDGMFKTLSKGWIYCSNTARLQKDGKIIKLTDKESNLIEYLLGLSNHRSSKRELFVNIWNNYSADSQTSTLDTHLYKLRQKLPDNMFIIDNDECSLNI